MICPHCKKPIDRKIPPDAIALAQKLKDMGFSLRDIEKMLHAKGYQASAASLCRKLK